MQLISRASLAFKKSKPALKTPFGSHVITILTPVLTKSKTVDDVVFHNLAVPLAELQALNVELAAPVSNALTGTPTVVASVKTAQTARDEAFTFTANYKHIGIW